MVLRETWDDFIGLGLSQGLSSEKFSGSLFSDVTKQLNFVTLLNCLFRAPFKTIS